MQNGENILEPQAKYLDREINFPCMGIYVKILVIRKFKQKKNPNPPFIKNLSLY